MPEHIQLALAAYAFVGAANYIAVRSRDNDNAPDQIKSVNQWGAFLLSVTWPLSLSFRLMVKGFFLVWK